MLFFTLFITLNTGEDLKIFARISSICKYFYVSRNLIYETMLSCSAAEFFTGLTDGSEAPSFTSSNSPLSILV